MSETMGAPTEAKAMSVRESRFELARAIGSLMPVSYEAVEQLDRAVFEPGDAPPDWELHRTSAEIMLGRDPVDAALRFARCAASGAPADVIRDATRCIAGLRRPSTRPVASQELGALIAVFRRDVDLLFGATVLKWLERHDEALRALAAIAEDDSSTRRDRLSLEVSCLIECGRGGDALALLDRHSHEDAPAGDDLEFLRARALFEMSLWSESLAVLDRLDRTDEAEALRTLALIGCDRAHEVTWARETRPTTTGPETWLSRGVAALVNQQFDAAAEAAAWVERSLPDSLSPTLIRVQAMLEGDDLAAGLEALESLNRAVRDRGAPPAWLLRQRRLRRDGRFSYFLCEYEMAMNRSVDTELLDAVDHSDTSYAQDGRLAEMRALGAPDDAQVIAALDTALSSYRWDNVHGAALRVARRAYELAPTAERATALGWTTYTATYLEPKADAPTLNGEEAIEALTKAAENVEAALVTAPDEIELDGATWLLAVMHRRRAELSAHGRRLAVAAVAKWSYLAALGSLDSPERQLFLEETLRMLIDCEAGAVEVVDYVQSLDPDRQLDQDAIDTLITSYSNLYGAHDLLVTLLGQAEQNDALDSNEPSEVHQQWMGGIRLRLALVSDDRDATETLLDVDVGSWSWALVTQAFATAKLRGLEPGKTRAGHALETIEDDDESLVERCQLFALSGDLRRAREELTRAEALGNDSPRELAATERCISFIEQREIAIEAFADREIDEARTQAELLYFVHAILPWLADATGHPYHSVLTVITPAVERRRHEIQEQLATWVDVLAELDDAAGALALLWRVATARQVSALPEALERSHALDGSPAFRVALDHALDGLRGWSAGLVLETVVRQVAQGSQPDAGSLALMQAQGTGIAALARLLGDLHPAAALDNLLADAIWRGREALRQVLLSFDSESLLALLETLYRRSDAGGVEMREAAVAVVLRALAVRAGFEAPTERAPRSFVEFILGTQLVPADTGPSWVLFSDYLPEMRRRLATEPESRIPGVTVRRDRRGEPNVVHIVIHGIVLETFHIPTTGGFVVVDPGAGDATDLLDPLSGHRVVHLGEGDSVLAASSAAWSPLEFAVRHLEHHLRSALASLVTVFDVGTERLVDGAGKEDAPTPGPGSLLAELRRLRQEFVASAIVEGSGSESPASLVGGVP